MKRYQIFISSTYTDLKEERSAVLECILKLRHIPVGMEQFVAANEEQFNYIKRLIDDTDYYILIIGNRYGSTGSDGISFTEKEFDYAVSKGIPVLAFVHSLPDSLPVNKSERSPSAKKKLLLFREKVTTNRLVSMFSWDSPASLSSEIAVALTNVFIDNPRPGWERVQSYDNAELLNQINDLRLENIALQKKLDEVLSEQLSEDKYSSFPWDESVQFTGRSKWDDYKEEEIPVELTWRKLFSALGPVLINKESVSHSQYALNHLLFGDEEPYFSVQERDFKKIIITFVKASVIEIKEDDINLTSIGKKFLFENGSLGDHIGDQTIQKVRMLKAKTSKEKRKYQKYIRDLSNFNSNPEATNYIGETLISLSVFLAEQTVLSKSDTERAQKLIKEILQEASEDERTQMGAFDPMFNLAKILELTTILRKGLCT